MSRRAKCLQPIGAECTAPKTGVCKLCQPDACARLSEASKRAWADPEVRARMSEVRKRALADPDACARLSEASKRAWADPEVRARISEATKRAWADPEVRARLSEARKRAWAKKAVRAAGLPLVRGLVDAARAYLAAGETVEMTAWLLAEDVADQAVAA